MSKGIIMMDVPENCRNIRGEKERGCPFGGMVCQIKQEDVMEHVKEGTKPDWCPIKEIPVRLEEIKLPHTKNGYKMSGFTRGWNACLDEIEGS